MITGLWVSAVVRDLLSLYVFGSPSWRLVFVSHLVHGDLDPLAHLVSPMTKLHYMDPLAHLVSPMTKEIA